MGSRSQTQQTLPSWAVPTAQSILGSSLDYVAPGSATGFNLQSLGLQPFNPALEAKLAPFNPTQEAGLGAVTSAAAPSAGLALSGAGEIQNTLGGAYLDPASNPYLTATYDAAARAATNQFREGTAPSDILTAQRGGVSGGSGERQGLALDRFNYGKNLTDLAAQMFGGNYAMERGIQANAPGQIGAAQAALAQPGQQLIGAGTLEQGQTQAAMDVATQNAQLRQQWAPTLISFLSNALGGATSGGGAVTAGTSK